MRIPQRSLVIGALFILCIVSGGALQAQTPEWIQHGPWGGQVWLMERTGSALIASTPYSGVFRSTDYGATWDRTLSPALAEPVQGFAAHGSVIVAFGGIRSMNEGRTWERINTGIKPFFMTFQGDTLITCTSSIQPAVYSSTDYGGFWLKRGVLPDGHVYCLIAHEGELFAGNATGLLRSGDGGRSWERMGSPDKDSVIHAIHISRDTILVASGSNPYAAASSVYYSVDRGTTWVLSSGLPAGRVGDFTESPHGILAAASRGGLFRSTDGGASWENIYSNPDGIGGIRAIVAVGDTVLVGHDANWTIGISRSMDGGTTWNQSSDGLSSLRIEHIISASDVLIAASYHEGLFRSTNDGVAWTRIAAGPAGSFITSIASCGNYLVCGVSTTDTAADQGIYRSSDTGATWTRTLASTRPARECTVAGGTIVALMQTYAYTDPGELHLSRDSGATWKLLDSPSLSPIRTVLLNGPALFVFSAGQVYRSDDFGEHWMQVSTFPDQAVKAAAFGDTIFLGLSNGHLLRSTDLGITWLDRQLYPIPGMLHDIIMWRKDLYAAINSILYHSIDGGDSWTEFLKPSEQNDPLALAVHKSRLYLGTSLSGIYSLALTSSVSMPELRAEELSLAPNPSRDNTLLHYRLAQPGNVRVEVCNSMGEQVMAFVEKERPAGEHTLRIDFTGQPTGYYFLRIETPDGIAARPVVIEH